ncbi:hypothetical protein BX600DRAFT_464609, partial [Xylariales sp. PMI_506]
MYKILPVLRAADPLKEGDFWRQQTCVPLPQLPIADHPDHKSLQSSPLSLKGKVIGAPKIFIGATQPDAEPVHISDSVLNLWKRAKRDLEAMGATVVETDFPVLTKYESVDPSDAMNIHGCPPKWFDFEREDLLAWTWDQFLQQSKDPNFDGLHKADPNLIFPLPENYLPDKFNNLKSELAYSALIQLPEKMRGRDIFGEPTTSQALQAFEAHRKQYLEDWMDERGLDLIVFPANGDVSRADLEINEESARNATRNGVKFSNGNRVIRHVGIPTVSVSMGIMADTQMPVNLTFAGKAYQDDELLKYAYAYEQYTRRRVPPPLTPALPTDHIPTAPSLESSAGSKERLDLTVRLSEPKDANATGACLRLGGAVTGPAARTAKGTNIEVYVDGELVDPKKISLDSDRGSWEAIIDITPRMAAKQLLSDYKNPPSKTMVVILAKSTNYRPSGHLLV